MTRILLAIAALALALASLVACAPAQASARPDWSAAEAPPQAGAPAALATPDPNSPGAIAGRAVDLAYQATALAAQQAEVNRQIAAMTADAAATWGAYELGRQQTADALQAAVMSDSATATARAAALAAQIQSDQATAQASQATSIAQQVAAASATAQRRAEIAEQDARVEAENAQTSARIWSIAGPLLVVAAIGILLFLGWYGATYILTMIAEQRRAEAERARQLAQVELLRQAVLETSRGPVFMQMTASGPVIEVIPKLPAPDDDAGDVDDQRQASEAPAAGFAYSVGGQPMGVLPRTGTPEEERARAAALALLKKAIAQNGEDSDEIPTHEAMGMSSKRWTAGRRALGNYLETAQGRAGGTWLKGKYKTLIQLRHACENREAILIPAPAPSKGSGKAAVFSFPGGIKAG